MHGPGDTVLLHTTALNMRQVCRGEDCRVHITQQQHCDKNPKRLVHVCDLFVEACRAAIRSWLQSKRGGTIILITSGGSLRARPGASAYQSTKLAINRLAQFIEADHGQQGIRAFAIHPGGVPTKLALGMPKDMYKVLVDTPQLSGGMCVYLTSNRADFLQGRYISSTWDVIELEARKQEILEKDLFKMQLAL